MRLRVPNTFFSHTRGMYLVAHKNLDGQFYFIIEIVSFEKSFHNKKIDEKIWIFSLIQIFLVNISRNFRFFSNFGELYLQKYLSEQKSWICSEK